MKVICGYKTEIDPNNQQRTALLRHAGAARVAYNWGLRRKIEAYKETGKSPSAIDLHRELNVLKNIPKADGGFPWMRESSKCAPQEALRNLDRAFANFFRQCKDGSSRKPGFPRFKSRKRGIGGFRLTGHVGATATHVILPRIGKIRSKEHGYFPVDAKILSVSVSEKAGRWFASLQVEHDKPDPFAMAERIIGVDVGISCLAVTSDGRRFENHKALRKGEGRLRRLQRKASRKENGSQNKKTATMRVARQHHRIACVRKDSIHKASSAIVKQASVIVLESLNVAGMLKNRRLSKALSDASMSELHRQIEYKARWLGVRIVRADRFFPSSKTCSGCGFVKKDLGIGERFCCAACGLAIDRDLNAAINLRNLAVSSTVAACGEASSGFSGNVGTKLVSVKQESNTDQGLSLIGSV